jgi:transforming growth factor-beta-induced protein
MRKLLILLVMLLVAVPLRAQTDDDDEKTLADALYDLQAQTNDYGLFIAALEADETILLQMQDPDALLTVFAPDDIAFAGTLEAADLRVDDLMQDADLLYATLAHHVVPAAFAYPILAENDLTYVLTTLEERGLLIQQVLDGIYINAVNAYALANADNGYLHGVDQLLIPPLRIYTPEEEPTIAEDTIAAALPEDDTLSLFMTLLEAADPRLLAQLDAVGPFTVFAPTDDAIQAYLDATGFTVDDLLADPSLLAQMLTYHILPGRIEAGSMRAIPPLLGGADFRLLSLNGRAVVVAVDADDGLTVNGVSLVTEDAFYANGVIHTLDAVLDPFADVAAQPGA